MYAAARRFFLLLQPSRHNYHPYSLTPPPPIRKSGCLTMSSISSKDNNTQHPLDDADPLVYSNRKELRRQMSLHTTNQLENELKRSNISVPHQKYLAVELSYRKEDPPPDKGCDDYDSDDGGPLEDVRSTLHHLDRKFSRFRYNRQKALLAKAVKVPVPPRSKMKRSPVVPLGESPRDSPIDTAGPKLDQCSNDSTALKACGTFHAATADLVLPKSTTSIASGNKRKKKPLGRVQLRPKRGCQVIPMAPAYKKHLRGTRFDKFIGEPKNKKDPEEYNTDDLDEERKRDADDEMYARHDYEDYSRLKKHFDDIDRNGHQLYNEDDADFY